MHTPSRTILIAGLCLLPQLVQAQQQEAGEEQVPLIAPKIKKEPKPPEPASAPAVDNVQEITAAPIEPTTPMQVQAEPEPPPAESIAKRTLHIGAKAVGLAQSGDLRGGTAGAIEFGVRLPFWGKRLGLMIEPMAGGLWGASQRAALWVSSPLAVTFHEAAGPGLLRVMAGPTIDYVSVSSRTAGATGPDTDRYVTLGATGGLGYVWQLGRGGLTIEARYRLLPYVVAGNRNISHGASLGVGYAFFLL